MAIVDPGILAQTAGIQLSNPYATNYQPLDITPVVQIQAIEQRNRAMQMQEEASRVAAEERQRRIDDQDFQRLTNLQERITGVNFLPKDTELKEEIFGKAYSAIDESGDPTQISKYVFDALNNPQTQKLLQEKQIFDETMRVAALNQSKLGPNYDAFKSEMVDYSIGNREDMPSLNNFLYIPVDEVLADQLSQFGPGTPKDVIKSQVEGYYQNPIVQRQLSYQGIDPNKKASAFLDQYLPAMDYMEQYQEKLTAAERGAAIKDAVKKGTPFYRVGVDSQGKALVSPEYMKQVSQKIAKSGQEAGAKLLLDKLNNSQPFQLSTMEDALKEGFLNLNYENEAGILESFEGKEALDKFKELKESGELVNPIMTMDANGQLSIKDEDKAKKTKLEVNLGRYEKLLENKPLKIDFEELQGKQKALAEAISPYIFGSNATELDPDTAASKGFDSVFDVYYGYGDIKNKDGTELKPNKKLTDMSIGEVLAFQEKLRRATEGTLDHTTKGTSAAGAFQIVGSTLKDLVKNNSDISMEDTFNEATQKKLFGKLLEKRGFEDVLTEKKTTEEFVNGLLKEWQGFEVNDLKPQLTAIVEAIKTTPESEFENNPLLGSTFANTQTSSSSASAPVSSKEEAVNWFDNKLNTSGSTPPIETSREANQSSGQTTSNVNETPAKPIADQVEIEETPGKSLSKGAKWLFNETTSLSQEVIKGLDSLATSYPREAISLQAPVLDFMKEVNKIKSDINEGKSITNGSISKVEELLERIDKEVDSDSLPAVKDIGRNLRSVKDYLANLIKESK